MKTSTINSAFISFPLYRSAAKSSFLLAALLLAACSASPKVPLAEIASAEQAIANAERAQVIRYTSTELNTARTELTAARNAVLADNLPQAQRLALQAQLSAELAIAQADLLKAQAVNKDMQQSIMRCSKKLSETYPEAPYERH